MIIKTVNFSDFVQSFHDMDRGEQFSYIALRELYDFYESMSEDTGEHVELDVIAICCDWTEDTEENIRNYYSIDAEQSVIEYLDDNTFAFVVGDKILYMNF